VHRVVKEDIDSILGSPVIDWEYLRGKSILITGAYGFIPSYFVYVLVAFNEKILKKSEKCDIIVLGRSQLKIKEKFTDYIDDKKISFIELDVINADQLNEKYDFIIHAASLASPKYYNQIPVDIFLPNIVGTWRLLENSKKHGCTKFLFLSSSEVYNGSTDAIFKEDSLGAIDSLDSRSCYSEGKRSGEMICQSYFNQFKIPIVISRIFHTYGPGVTLNDGRIFADFVKNVVRKEDIVIQGNGTAVRSYCYLSDTITGLLVLLTKGEPGNAYNIGNPLMTFSSKKLAELIIDLPLVEKGAINIFGQKQEEESKIIPDIKKISALDWSPKISAEEGFYRTIKTYFE
jgi:nucleoside-diphosphate-sugar epimerase